jgi:hypothetical protein
MPANPIENVFIRLVANHQLELFADAAATKPLLDTDPLLVKGNGGGSLQFNFILNMNPGHHNGNIETADLIIVPHVLITSAGTVKTQKKDSPFSDASRALVINDPGGTTNPGNLKGKLAVRGGAGAQYIPAGQLKIRKVSSLTGVFKYTIIAVSDDGADFDFVDPTIIIEP